MLQFHHRNIKNRKRFVRQSFFILKNLNFVCWRKSRCRHVKRACGKVFIHYHTVGISKSNLSVLSLRSSKMFEHKGSIFRQLSCAARSAVFSYSTAGMTTVFAKHEYDNYYVRANITLSMMAINSVRQLRPNRRSKSCSGFCQYIIQEFH